MPSFRAWVQNTPRHHFSTARFILTILITAVGVTAVGILFYVMNGKNSMLEAQKSQLQVEAQSLQSQLTDLRNEDQVVKNAKLAEEMQSMQKTYGQAVTVYEALLDLSALTRDTGKLSERLAGSLARLSKREWASASADLATLATDIEAAKVKIASTFTIPANVVESNTAPSSGFSRQSVKTDIGTFLVDLVAADMGSTRVIVDTASDGTCTKDCPALPLGDYVSRSGAYAGINGSYFCPADYPSCAEKKNSFDTLLMNKNKTYFNSDNNVYSTVPAAIFLGGSMRFVGASQEWGRDTSPDGVIANQPLLLLGGNITFGGGSDPKQGSRGSRSFVGSRGSTAYIGVVHNATVAEVAIVLKALGLEGALNLDSGGSTALWSGGYKVGPGRAIPNAILFVRK
jgi:hypothetical protein